MELGIFERQLRLMVLLTQNREYSLEELCRKLDMSRRTLYRYLELFRDIGFEVVKQGSVYRLDKSSPFFKEITQLVHFTEDEALTLRTCSTWPPARMYRYAICAINWSVSMISGY